MTFLLSEKYNLLVSVTAIRKLLYKHKYSLRKAQKKQTMKTVKDKNAQFENITQFKSEYQSSDNPIISKDTSEFVCDSPRDWRHNKSLYNYPHATLLD